MVMQTSVVGYPRIGANRELKFAIEGYFKGTTSVEELQAIAKSLRLATAKQQQVSGIDFVTLNFSYYDNFLDTAVLFNIIPAVYKNLGLSNLDTYFAMARGYQGSKGDVKALGLKKWFNTNYHYIVAEIDDTTEVKLVGDAPFAYYQEALEAKIITKPSIIGPYTLLKLLRYRGQKTAVDFIDDVCTAYLAYLAKFTALQAPWVALEEPALSYDLSTEDRKLFTSIYQTLFATLPANSTQILLQTYFGDIRDSADLIAQFPFAGVGLDFIEGKEANCSLLQQQVLANKTLIFAGVVNGKNIWRNNYAKSLAVVHNLEQLGYQVVLSTSCSLLHVPYSLEPETALAVQYKEHLAYAQEKLGELHELSVLATNKAYQSETSYQQNIALHASRPDCNDPAVQQRVQAIKDTDYTRNPCFAEREQLQKAKLQLPLLPTTTIGSFPQTAEVKAKRAAFKRGLLSAEEYQSYLQQKIASCVQQQEELGFDVLVHGEFERNDMVEYFGAQLVGYLFTTNAWVQSYGTRCVKPPVIWGDISRKAPMTVAWSVYAQSLTKKTMKGMLTGPVTILNWSFPREDISLEQSALQIALAIRDEVLDLEKNGITVIQVDEAALREKLPLRKSDWESKYLTWAIPAFRLVHSGVQATTQIHTHMCYSEFADIIQAIDDMDADVITFEASRSDLQLLDTLRDNNFKTEVGPGVYDIHSPRVPSVDEITMIIKKMLTKIDVQKLWVNPDCGLKTRGEEETNKSLANLVQATRNVRNSFAK